MPEHGGHNIPPMPPMPGISPKLLQMPLPQAFSAPREASAAFSPASDFFYLIFTAKHQVVLGSIVSLHPVFNAVRFYISQHRGWHQVILPAFNFYTKELHTMCN